MSKDRQLVLSSSKSRAVAEEIINRNALQDEDECFLLGLLSE